MTTAVSESVAASESTVPAKSTAEGIDPSQQVERYFFDTVVVKMRQSDGVWAPTPHGQTFGVGLSKARHAVAGKTIIEIGTGTGIHAIAALKLGARHMDVTDIDDAALQSAQENATLNSVQLRTCSIQDWMNFEPAERYDTVLCNPPFCKAGTPDRRFFIQKMIAQAPKFLRPGGHLMFSQSSMANFALTEAELEAAGFIFEHVHTYRGMFRDYYFTEPNFIEESRAVDGGFEEIDGVYIETIKAYLCTLIGDGA